MNLAKIFSQLIGAKTASSAQSKSNILSALKQDGGKSFLSILQSKGLSKDQAAQIKSFINNNLLNKKAFIGKAGLEVSIEYPRQLISSKSNSIKGLSQLASKVPNGKNLHSLVFDSDQQAKGTTANPSQIKSLSKSEIEGIIKSALDALDQGDTPVKVQSKDVSETLKKATKESAKGEASASAVKAATNHDSDSKSEKMTQANSPIKSHLKSTETEKGDSKQQLSPHSNDSVTANKASNGVKPEVSATFVPSQTLNQSPTTKSLNDQKSSTFESPSSVRNSKNKSEDAAKAKQAFFGDSISTNEEEKTKASSKKLMVDSKPHKSLQQIVEEKPFTPQSIDTPKSDSNKNSTEDQKDSFIEKDSKTKSDALKADAAKAESTAKNMGLYNSSTAHHVDLKANVKLEGTSFSDKTADASNQKTINNTKGKASVAQTFSSNAKEHTSAPASSSTNEAKVEGKEPKLSNEIKAPKTEINTATDEHSSVEKRSKTEGHVDLNKIKAEAENKDQGIQQNHIRRSSISDAAKADQASINNIKAKETSSEQPKVRVFQADVKPDVTTEASAKEVNASLSKTQSANKEAEVKQPGGKTNLNVNEPKTSQTPATEKLETQSKYQAEPKVQNEAKVEIKSAEQKPSSQPINVSDHKENIGGDAWQHRLQMQRLKHQSQQINERLDKQELNPKESLANAQQSQPKMATNTAETSKTTPLENSQNPLNKVEKANTSVNQHDMISRIKNKTNQQTEGASRAQKVEDSSAKNESVKISANDQLYSRKVEDDSIRPQQTDTSSTAKLNFKKSDKGQELDMPKMADITSKTEVNDAKAAKQHQDKAENRIAFDSQKQNVIQDQANQTEADKSAKGILKTATTQIKEDVGVQSQQMANGTKVNPKEEKSAQNQKVDVEIKTKEASDQINRSFAQSQTNQEQQQQHHQNQEQSRENFVKMMSAAGSTDVDPSQKEVKLEADNTDFAKLMNNQQMQQNQQVDGGKARVEANQHVMRTVQKEIVEQAKAASANWQRQRIVLENGGSLNLSLRSKDGVLQLQVGSLGGEIAKIIQQNATDIRQHLEQQLNIKVDLQFGQQPQGDTSSSQQQAQQQMAGFGQQSSNSSFGNQSGNRGFGGNESNASSANSTNGVDEVDSSSPRNYGTNSNEWTA